MCIRDSAGIEPIAANSYTHKTLSGSFTVRNRYLKKLLIEKGKDTPEIWSSITTNEGSVQHLEFLSEEEKDVFKTAFELDQRWVIELAGDRSEFICQSQSINVFLPSDVHKKTLHDIHWNAWKKGVKSLYYCRSKSIQRAEAVSQKVENQNENLFLVNGSMPVPSPDAIEIPLTASAHKNVEDNENDYEECLSCQ